jgi:hypothetical protein
MKIPVKAGELLELEAYWSSDVDVGPAIVALQLDFRGPSWWRRLVAWIHARRVERRWRRQPPGMFTIGELGAAMGPRRKN